MAPWPWRSPCCFLPLWLLSPNRSIYPPRPERDLSVPGTVGVQQIVFEPVNERVWSAGAPPGKEAPASLRISAAGLCKSARRPPAPGRHTVPAPADQAVTEGHRRVGLLPPPFNSVRGGVCLTKAPQSGPPAPFPCKWGGRGSHRNSGLPPTRPKEMKSGCLLARLVGLPGIRFWPLYSSIPGEGHSRVRASRQPRAPCPPSPGSE